MGYKIIKDVINAGDEVTLHGRTYDDYQGGKARYRLLDDDGNVYFYIMSDVDYNTTGGTEDQLFAPVDRFMYSYGVTTIQFKDSDDGKYKTL